ncbi:hypothetical protein PFLmoz3_05525 [Pseudomonas fluorescens]|uniref:Uncharacterized protein n=1 Tax=Pseudomonas fluorescens TaxID=294 RepID=A0A109LC45_PSEFL|nr:hypothetical protein PFLmoz3_05525 [Pseudomonas fluorescens]
MHRQQLGTGGAFAAIKLLRIQAQHVNPETDRALGKAGLGIKDKILRPLFGLALGVGRVGEVAIEVGITQVERGLGVVDKAFGVGTQRQSDGQAAETEKAQASAGMTGGLTHSEAPFVLLFLLFDIRCRTTLSAIFARF